VKQQVEDIVAGTKGWDLDPKRHFSLDPMKWIGGAAWRYA